MKNETTRKITMPWGESIKMKTNLSEASAPIMVDFCAGNGWEYTQYQTADASHSVSQAVGLVSELAWTSQDLADLDWDDVEVEVIEEAQK